MAPVQVLAQRGKVLVDAHRDPYPPYVLAGPNGSVPKAQRLRAADARTVRPEGPARAASL
eukprot:3009489-Rhodomonas_salina.3